jgi:hypothetical protein
VLKRVVFVVFAISLFASPVSAKKDVTPDWVRQRYKAGENCKEWEYLFRQYKLPVVLFSYTAYRESRCRASAVNARWDKHGNLVWTLNRNGTFDSGLLQINSSWRSVTRQVCGGGLDRLFDPVCNVKVAAHLYHGSGAGHWGYRTP